MKRFFLRCDKTNSILCEVFEAGSPYYILSKDKYPIEVILFNESKYNDFIRFNDTVTDFITGEEIKIENLSKVAI